MAIRRRFLLVTASALMLALPSAATLAAGQEAAPGWTERSPDYWNAHPDQGQRMLGLAALRDGRDVEARSHFERAARYADKAAQALLADLWWEGRGGPRDRALGYAWMDLAAERGDPSVAARREYYWSELDEASRQRALEQGKAIYAEFADDVAQPRLERERRRWTRIATGSRLGSPGAARVCNQVGTGGNRSGAVGGGLDACGIGVDSAIHYADARLSPADYWRARDAELAFLFGHGGAVQAQPVR